LPIRFATTKPQRDCLRRFGALLSVTKLCDQLRPSRRTR
jgi:hypothetical protein